MSSTPHDALFKAVFSAPRAASSELQAILPLEIASRIDWSQLRLEPGSFVDKHLRARYSDLLFSTRVASREARIYLLFEHRSEPDPLMPFRLLVYVVRIWEAILTQEPKRKRLPLILPVVIHHGPSGWRAATNMSELIDLEEPDRAIFAPFLPQFRFVLDDLASQNSGELERRSLSTDAKLALLALRDIRDATDLHVWLRSVAELVQALIVEPQGRQAFAKVIEYIFLVHDEVDVQSLVKEAEQIALGAGEPVMTIARQLIEQGIERGIEQGIERGIEQGIERGIEQGARNMLLRLLSRFFGAPSDAHRERIERASAVELECWVERVPTATSIDDVLR